MLGQSIQEVTPHIPTSPQAEAFKQHGEYAINYSMGVPNISIPLYHINHRGYQIPLALSYSPQPLKPGYNYDVYGHGWALSIGSSISRTIESQPDELNNFKLDNVPMGNYYFTLLGNPYGEHTDFDAYNLAYDTFNVTLPNGTSFDFIIDDNEIIISDGRSLKINYSYNTSNINSFTVVDEDGVTYTFNEGDTPYRGTSLYGSRYVSWKLTHIDLPNSSQPIIFNYGYTIESPYQTSCLETGFLINSSFYLNGTTHNSYPVADSKNTYSSSSASYKMKLLSSITYGSTKIILNYKDQDLVTTYNYVDQIKILENSSLIKDIRLSKSIHNLQSPSCISTLVAKLDSVSIGGSNAQDKRKVFKCEYESDTSTYSFSGTDHWGSLNSHSSAYDVANFNMFVPLKSDKVTLFLNSTGAKKSLVKTATDLSPYTKIKISRYDHNIRKPSSPSAHHVLSKLFFPTGGYTAFKFENHKFLSSTANNGNFILDPQNRIPAQAAGFRIREITNYTNSGVKASVKSYQYGRTDDEPYDDDNRYLGIGIAVVDPNILTYMSYSSYGLATHNVNFLVNAVIGLDDNGNYTSFSNEFESNTYTLAHPWALKCEFSALNFRRIVNGRQSVIYPKVTEYHQSFSDANATLGKTVYKYDLEIEGYDFLRNLRNDLFIEEPFYSKRNIVYIPKKHLYNNLKEKIVFKFDGIDFIPVKKDTYSWSYSGITKSGYVYSDAFPSYTVVGHYNKFTVNGDYLTISGIVTIGKASVIGKTTTLYDDVGNEDMVSTESYSYNQRNQLAKKTIKTSKENDIEHYYNYPETVSNGTTPTIIQKMIAQNIISPLIETKTTITETDQTPKIISGNKIEFKEFTIGTSKIIMPFEVYQLLKNPSHNDFTLENKIISYSANGNPLESVHKDITHNSYLWGYNDRYMVLKAENIDNTTLSTIVASSLPPGYSTLEHLLHSFSSLPNTNWDVFNKNLRNNLPANVMVTTYTYAPLIGVTSITSPNNKTITYHYDSFARLSQVIDENGNILKENKYHYKESQ